MPGTFRFPKGITTDSEGYIMVADYGNDRLQLFEPDGDFIRAIDAQYFSKHSSKNFERPVAILAIDDGPIVVATWGRSQKVQIF
jgi:tripartite motif-containing protein 71